jgi:hypothetical protein
MYKYFELKRVRTSKYIGGDWQKYDKEYKRFESKNEVKEWLNNEYSHVKTKYPMYSDFKDGSSKRIGTIFSWKEKDYYTDYKTNYMRDWIEVREHEALDNWLTV